MIEISPFPSAASQSGHPECCPPRPPGGFLWRISWGTWPRIWPPALVVWMCFRSARRAVTYRWHAPWYPVSPQQDCRLVFGCHRCCYCFLPHHSGVPNRSTVTCWSRWEISAAGAARKPSFHCKEKIDWKTRINIMEYKLGLSTYSLVPAQLYLCLPPK